MTGKHLQTYWELELQRKRGLLLVLGSRLDGAKSDEGWTTSILPLRDSSRYLCMPNKRLDLQRVADIWTRSSTRNLKSVHDECSLIFFDLFSLATFSSLLCPDFEIIIELIHHLKQREYRLAELPGLPLDCFPETDEKANRAQELRALVSLRNNWWTNSKKLLLSIMELHHFQANWVPWSIQQLKSLIKFWTKCSRRNPYDLAAAGLNPCSSRHFRLMFLRCHLFDRQAAAELIVHHFQVTSDDSLTW